MGSLCSLSNCQSYSAFVFTFVCIHCPSELSRADLLPPYTCKLHVRESFTFPVGGYIVSVHMVTHGWVVAPPEDQLS